LCYNDYSKIFGIFAIYFTLGLQHHFTYSEQFDMKTFIAIILLAFFVTSFATAESINLNFECTDTGTKITGEKTSKQFKEKFALTKTENYIKKRW